MNAGIPGIGLGGLFFVLSALMMLFVEMVRTIQGRSSLARWRVVGRQAGMALGIVFVSVAALWLLDRALLAFGGGQRPANIVPIGGGTSSGGLERSLWAAVETVPLAATPILGTFVLLTLLLFAAEVARWTTPRPKAAKKQRSLRG